ncbi:MAG: UPF0182 family protein [Gemmatimonadaceae bacterium]
MTVRRWALLAALAVACSLLLGRAASAVYVDYRFYAVLGAGDVWRARGIALIVMKGLARVVATLFLFGHLYAVRQSVVSLVLPRRLGNVEIGEEVPGRYLVGAALVIAVVLGMLLPIADSWSSLALGYYGLPFGESDPYHEVDLGFFTYVLPLEGSLYLWALVVILVAAAVVIFLYALTPSLRWQNGSLYVSNYVRRHLMVIGALLLGMLAWSYRLEAFKVLLNGSSGEGAFGYTDHHAIIPVDLTLAVLTLVAAIVVVWFGWSGQVRVAFGAVGTVLILSLSLRQLAPLVVRRSAPARTAGQREAPYRATRVAYTRRAFGLDRLGPADPAMSFSSLREVSTNVPAWEPAALARAVARGSHGELGASGVGWIPSAVGVVAVVPEHTTSVSGGDPEQQEDRWSVARILGASADADGGPVHVTLSGQRAREDDRLEPVIVHDSATGYLVEPDSLGRLTGSSLESSLSRVAHAWSLQNLRLLSDLPRPSPRIIVQRALRDRVRAVAPIFLQGTEITPVAIGDTLFWLLDLYSASASYPLSTRIGIGPEETTYLQHAATAVVNGASGRLWLAADATLDPIARSWVQAFPSLFTSWARLPRALAEAAPPALDLLRSQAQVMARFGLRGDSGPTGQVPWNIGADTLMPEGSTALWLLPGRRALAWSQPILDENGHVLGLFVGTGGPSRHAAYLPLAHAGTRWSAASDELHRAADSSLILPAGTQAVRGGIHAVPVGDDVAFVQSTYAWRADAPPALVRVSALLGDAVTTGRTLPEALGVAVTPPSETSTPSPDYRSRVAALVEQMRAALQRADWTAFGRAFDALETLTRASR